MNSILIQFAHPRLEKSRMHKALLRALPKNEKITVNDLYQAYPDFNIDTEREKELLLRHDIIILQHPLYWYSAPPLLKQWIDIVLEYGWAYGPGGTALKGKYVFNCITSGGPRQAYSKEGYHKFTLREFLTPFERTTTLCNMVYLPPFALQGTHRLTDEELNSHLKTYSGLLQKLMNEEINPEFYGSFEYLNDIFTSLKGE